MFQGIFVCSYDNIASYPFDTEYCFVELCISGSENNFTVLIPKNITYSGPYIGQYRVKNLQLDHIQLDDGRNRLRFFIEFVQNIGSVMLVRASHTPKFPITITDWRAHVHADPTMVMFHT